MRAWPLLLFLAGTRSQTTTTCQSLADAYTPCCHDSSSAHPNCPPECSPPPPPPCSGRAAVFDASYTKVKMQGYPTFGSLFVEGVLSSHKPASPVFTVRSSYQVSNVKQWSKDYLSFNVSDPTNTVVYATFVAASPDHVELPAQATHPQGVWHSDSVGTATIQGDVFSISSELPGWNGVEELLSVGTWEVVDRTHRPTSMLGSLQTAATRGACRVVMVGFAYESYLAHAATQFPAVEFSILDFDMRMRHSSLSNVKSFIVAMYQTTFVAGLHAAAASSTKNVSFVGGQDAVAIRDWAEGFVRGAQHGGATVFVDFVGSWEDESALVPVLDAHRAGGVDVFFSALGGTFRRAAQYAEEHGMLTFGADEDYTYLSSVIGSAIKNTSVGAKYMLEEESEGSVSFLYGKTYAPYISKDATFDVDAAWETAMEAGFVNVQNGDEPSASKAAPSLIPCSDDASWTVDGTNGCSALGGFLTGLGEPCSSLHVVAAEYGRTVEDTIQMLERCPRSCGACDSCSDDASWTVDGTNGCSALAGYLSNMGEPCSSLHVVAAAEYGRTMEDTIQMLEHCPRSCGTCG